MPINFRQIISTAVFLRDFGEEIPPEKVDKNF